MTVTVPTGARPTGSPVPTSDVDPFSHEVLEDPLPMHTELREAGPVVHLSRYDVHAMARYDEVYAALVDWQGFQSAAGVGLSVLLGAALIVVERVVVGAAVDRDRAVADAAPDLAFGLHENRGLDAAHLVLVDRVGHRLVAGRPFAQQLQGFGRKRLDGVVVALAQGQERAIDVPCRSGVSRDRWFRISGIATDVAPTGWGW